MFNRFALICVALTTLSTTAFAFGGNGSGGGDVVVMPSHGDDQVLLADPWLKTEAPAGNSDCTVPFTLPKQVVDELGRVTYILSVYGNGDQSSDNPFVDQRVLDKNIHYCLVDALPKRKSCDRRMDYSSLPAGAKVVPAACTEGSYTWVVKDLLKTMPVREQAKLYVHEGLRRTNTPEETIADVTDGLDLLLKQYNQEIGGTLTNMSKTQTDQVLEFKKTLAIAGLTSSDPRDLSVSDLEQINDGIVINRGGGVVSTAATVDSSAYVGVGMIIGPLTTIGAGSVLVNSQVEGDVKIGKNTRVISSKLNVCPSSSRNLEIGDNDLIERSAVSLTCQPLVADPRYQDQMSQHYMGKRRPSVFGNRVVVKDSTMTYSYLVFNATVGNGSRIFGSALTNTALESGAVVEGSSIFNDLDLGIFKMASMSEVSVRSGAVVSNVHLNKGASQNYFGLIQIGKNAHVRNIGLTNTSMEISVGYQVGGLLLGMATFGIGPIALSFGVGNGGKLLIPDGASIDGHGRAACPRGAHVSYGEVLTGNVVGSMRDFSALCQRD